MPHLCGRILRPSMHDRFEEKWISSLEDSPASRSHTPGKENLQKIRDICSHTLKELSANAPQGLYSLKTWKESSLLNLKETKTPPFSSMSFPDFNRWVTKTLRPCYLARRNVARLIKENESSLAVYPTVTVSDSFGSRRATAKKEHWTSHSGTTLTDTVQENWPTPRAGTPGSRKPGTGGKVLSEEVKRWPTPDATNAGDGIAWETSKKQMEERRAKVKQDVKDGKTRQGSGRSANLAMSVQKWPTPAVTDTEGAPHKLNENGERISAKGVKWGVKLQDIVNWATPQVTDSTRDNQTRKPEELTDAAKQGGCRNLREDVQNWPTPTMSHVERGNNDEPLENYQKRVKDYEEGRAKGKPGKSLGVAARQQENWATPQARDHKDTQGVSLERMNPQGKERGTNGTLPLEVYSLADPEKNNSGGKPQEQSEKPKKLSSLWVAQIMQLMPMWCVVSELTPCDFWETDVFPTP